jgi:hypothetical protein
MSSAKASTGRSADADLIRRRAREDRARAPARSRKHHVRQRQQASPPGSSRRPVREPPHCLD